MDYLINALITVLSVIVGGLVTMGIGKKEIHVNSKITIYLEFLNVIDGRYNLEITNEYLKALRKVMLIANNDVINVLLEHRFIPNENQKFLEIDDKSRNAFGDILRAIRKDIGLNNRYLNNFDSPIYYFKKNT